MLKNASAGSAAPSATAGTSGSTAAASSYRLDGEDAKLTPHVGHKVEITGSTAASDRPSAGAATGAGAGATTGAAASAGATLKVESVKMISASCTP